MDRKKGNHFYIAMGIFSLMLAGMILSGCQPSNGSSISTKIAVLSTATITSTHTEIPENPAPGITPSATTTPTVTITPTKTSTPTITQTPSPTKLACAEEAGAVIIYDFASEILGEDFRFRVYTPPCYREFEEMEYPVLYLIHGLGFDDEQWDRLGVDEAMDRLLAEGSIPPFIIVMPKDNEGTSPINDKFGEALVQELVPFINEHYRTKSERAYQGIGGISRGAAWAAHLSLRFWEMFGVVGLHSLPVFYYDEWKVPNWLEEIPEDEFPRVYLDIGKDDRPQVLESAQWFTDLLDERYLPYEYYLFNGRHNEEYWASHVEDYLLWYSAEWWE